jgi:myxalamid-type polyketide synthase MxaE and MxaD
VQFADALTTLFNRGSRLFVEIGPDLTLGRVIAECAAAAGHTVTVLPSLRRGQSERSTMGKSLTALNQAMAAPVDAAPP